MLGVAGDCGTPSMQCIMGVTKAPDQLEDQHDDAGLEVGLFGGSTAEDKKADLPARSAVLRHSRQYAAA